MDSMGDTTYLGNIAKNLLKLKNKFKKLGKSLIAYMKKKDHIKMQKGALK